MGAKTPPVYISEFSAEQTKWPGLSGRNNDLCGVGTLSWRQEEREGRAVGSAMRGKDPEGSQVAPHHWLWKKDAVPLHCPALPCGMCMCMWYVYVPVWVKLLRGAVLGTRESNMRRRAMEARAERKGMSWKGSLSEDSLKCHLTVESLAQQAGEMA